ncbi:MAG: helix-turn-helix transcriptional regulator [Pseudomonadota bacterium]
MDIQQAVRVFDTLSQETRLRAFRLLVKAGPGGLPAGKISEALGTPHNTMSFHLNHLSNSGVVSSRREGRSIIYSANFALTQALLTFVAKDCCSEAFTEVREDAATGDAVIEMKACCA